MFKNDEPFHRDGKTLWINCKANWHMNIVDAIESSMNGDQLVVDDHEKRELALSAIRRMKPGQDITCVIA